MASRNSGALNVFRFQPNAQCIDSCEGLYSIVETMINHPNNGYLVIQNPSHRLKTSFSSHCVPATIQIAPELPVKLIISVAMSQFSNIYLCLSQW